MFPTFAIGNFRLEGRHARSEYSEMGETVLQQRVAARLSALGLKPIPTATGARLGRDFITDILNGRKKSVRGDKLETLAEALETSPEYLLGATDDPSPGLKPRRPMVRLVGYVSAGAQAHYFASSDDPGDYVDAPEDWTQNTVAAEIRGTSLGPALDRWIVYYDDVRSPVTEDLYNRLCVVGTEDQVLVKVLRPTTTKNRFHLLSNGTEEPMFDRIVQWAALVKGMKPR